MWCDSHCHVPYGSAPASAPEGTGGAPAHAAAGVGAAEGLGTAGGVGTEVIEGLGAAEGLGTAGGVGTEVIEEARQAGVTRLVSVGTDAAQSAAAIEVARAYDEVWATVGLHPHDASQGVEGLEPLLALGDPKVVGIGECGLDYHYDLSPRRQQQEAFAAQVAMAKQLSLTLVIHTRAAWDDTFNVLADVGVPDRVVFHCFTGGTVEARRALGLGAWLSFSGIVTFKNASDIREAAALCPLDRLLVETDSPYLAPVPYRGQPNRPALVPVVGAAVAAAKGLDVAEVEAATFAASAQAFALPPWAG